METFVLGLRLLKDGKSQISRISRRGRELSAPSLFLSAGAELRVREQRSTAKKDGGANAWRKHVLVFAG